MSKVKQGMSRNEVEKLFGNPDLRRFDNDYEEWEFHSDIPGIKEYPGLNHLFQHCKTGSPSEYGEIIETISKEVLRDIAGFLKEIEIK